MKTLDFMIIGAQKCATTALHEYLRYHPRIVMPLEKELPFFTQEVCTEERWSKFASGQFGAATNDRLWGKASPQYMCDPGAPARIKSLMPDVKLVAILRDPIDRTLSHYQMGQRRETESRDISAALTPLLHNNTSEHLRDLGVPEHLDGYQSEADFYVAWSEYGRALSGFYAHFDAGQVLVLYTEELESHPEETLDRLLNFIGLPAGYRPSTLGKVIHRGGSGKRVPQSVREWLRERRVLYWLWQQIPDAQRGRLRFQYEQWNITQRNTPAAMPAELTEALRDHFQADLRQLLALPVAPPPWLNHYLAG